MKNSKCSSVGKVFTIAAAWTLALAIAPMAHASDKGCSNLTLRGTYAQTGSGVITAPRPSRPIRQCRDTCFRRKRRSYWRAGREQ
jgi:hypothetical protein